MSFRSSVSAVINRVGRSALRVRTLKASASRRHELANDPPVSRAPLDDDLLAARRAQPNLIGTRIQRERPRGQGRARRESRELAVILVHRALLAVAICHLMPPALGFFDGHGSGVMAQRAVHNRLAVYSDPW